MNCYWRFKGDRFWYYGYMTEAKAGFVRMGRYSGDTIGGAIVSKEEIEIKEWN